MKSGEEVKIKMFIHMIIKNKLNKYLFTIKKKVQNTDQKAIIHAF